MPRYDKHRPTPEDARFKSPGRLIDARVRAMLSLQAKGDAESHCLLFHNIPFPFRPEKPFIGQPRAAMIRPSAGGAFCQLVRFNGVNLGASAYEA